MDRSQQVFEQYVTGELTYLKSLQSKQIETDLQDFKLANSGMDTNAKKSYSEALSGFANAEGGVIIWGGDCRKNAADEDVLQQLSPVPNILKFFGELNNLGPQLVSPSIIGVTHHYFEDVPGSGNGFAISHIPAGEGLPHMATGKSLSRYMYRSGSSFMPMSHWMLADRFGRRPHPLLRLECVTWGEFYKVVIHNYGAATARYPGFTLKKSDSFRPGAFNKSDTPRGITIETTQESVQGQSNNDFVIHPKRSLNIGLIKLSEISHPFQFEYELFADGAYTEDMFRAD